MSRPSRLQRQVLSLYRELLRAGRGKPGAEARVRAEFRQHACLPRSDVLRIEYLYRRGRRQLQLLRSGHAKTLDAFERRQGANEEPGEAGAPTTQPQKSDDSRNPLEWSHRKSRGMDGDRPKSSDGAGKRCGGTREPAWWKVRDLERLARWIGGIGEPSWRCRV
ncbi:succinate dehydrogenase assembly factor 1, mitochondrial isoform X1 [Pipistrellus kuhlii]|uniref:succinate dehydrogenase assembly factor 1, mitochondrial isoform X1 n=1 Tax=Pipistrellus kuhlii TaxID=59472 RepID=UPI00174F2B4E|nr:succinate dehydrogenase assembly factor 1, mitochondrial isoform X1 [Pipistrellus kuhlii]